MGYFKDTKKGILWIGGFRGLTRGFSVIRTIILARLLTPDQFGVYGIAVLVLAFLEIFTETGINIVLVQAKDSVSKYINTAWVVSIVRGFLISITIFLLSPLLGQFFNSSSAVSLIQFTALVPLVRGFINPSEVRFQKDLLFRSEFFFRSAIFIIDTTVVVFVAFLTHSPFALICGLLAGAVFEVILSLSLLSPRPRIEFHKEKLFYILSRGKWLTLSGMLDYIFQNGDNLVVGKLLGAHALGLYQTAYQFATLPVTEVSNILSRVTFPIFMKMSEDKKRLFSAYSKTVIAIFSIVTPISLIFIIFPEFVIKLLLGDAWLEAASALRILAVLGVVRSIVLSSYAIFLTRQLQKYVTIVGALGTATMLTSIPLLISMYGISGAAIAALLGSLVSMIAVLILLRKTRLAWM